MQTFEEKISALSTVPLEYVHKLKKYINHVQSHDVACQLMTSGNFIEVETMEGRLLLNIVEDTVEYKFIPNDDFNSIIIDTILNRKSAIVTAASSRLIKALSNTYKDLL